jgi:UDP-N-acetylmuramoyl-L-alanyl-D-glutamate--2,6-diaminopimelate ligase
MVARGCLATRTGQTPAVSDFFHTPVMVTQVVRAGSGDSGAIVAEVLLHRRLAVRAALREAQVGDVVIIAGKDQETGQTAGGVTAPFDDRWVPREELARLGWEVSACA